jgi:hypothetical protein
MNKLFISVKAVTLFILLNTVSKQVAAQVPVAASKEKKADYLERIYFSGKNKEGLNIMILESIQLMEEKTATEAVARQYTFLSEIKDKAASAENSCDILEILASGIFALDAIDASALGVSLPGDKAKKQSIDAIAGLSKIGNSANGLSTTASTAGLNSYTLSGGKANILSTTSKIAGTANAISGAAGTLSSTINTAKEVKEIIKSFGIGGKDKPCKKVPQKDIAIGEHIVPDSILVQAAATAENAAPVQAPAGTETKITIRNISFNLLSDVAAILEKTEGVNSVNSDDFSNNTATLAIVHKLKLKDIITKIQSVNPKIRYNIESTSSTGAVLVVTAAK